jgi:hypothetical protein
MRQYSERQGRPLALLAVRAMIVLLVCGPFWYGIAVLAERLTA